MNKTHLFVGTVALFVLPNIASAVVIDFESETEGFLGTSYSFGDVTFRDVNNVSGFYADGAPFGPGDPGSQLIIENATLFYNDFPSFGSPINVLTFGSAFVPGDNLSIGALASVYMDFATAVDSVSFDIAFYENGPWGDITYHLDAISGGNVVASDSFVIANGGGRDNGTWQSMSVSGATFDTVQLYATKNGSYTVPRGMIDDLTFNPVPEPASMLVLGLGAMAVSFKRKLRR